MTKIYHTIFYFVTLFVIAYMGVDIFYRIVISGLDQINTEETMARRIPDIEHRKKAPLAYFRVIAERNLFGSIEGSFGDINVDEIKNLEPTSLNVVLLGTVTGDDKDAYAVIKEKGNKKQDLYRVGDSIEKAVVKKILRGKVVLNFKGRDEILIMEEPRSSQASKRHSPGPTATGSSITLKRSDMRGPLKNINRLLSEVKIRPHLKSGKADGVSLSGIKGGSVFSKMGLVNGDIVREIDGIAIRSPDDIMRLYKQLKFGSRVSLLLSRQGNMRRMEYSFR
ncbi:MAG: PDZ domain-containing protein [Desulfobacterales bacterium]|nr:PDZ domain-containing protein [Desulfobacterales bacterium]